MKIYWEIFYSFLKIGLFTIGGGWAMVSVIEQEIVHKKGWMTKEEFVDSLAIAQTVPGVLAINMANCVGYHIQKKKGALMAILGSALPSFLIILVIAMFFKEIKDNPVVERIFKGIRPAVVALICVPVFTTAKSVGINFRNVIIPILSALVIWLFKISPAYVFLFAAIGGIVYIKYFQK
jgi:Chromate transport protein ChrA